MNIREYIESGIIEAYASGMLTGPEAEEVESMAEKHTEVRSALNEAREAVEKFASAYKVQPKPEWKHDILSAAFKADDNPKSSFVDSGNTERAVNLKVAHTAGKISKNWFIAATIALLISLSINIFQHLSIKDIKSELSATNIRLGELEEEQHILVTSYREATNNLAVLTDPQTSSIVMKGVEGREAGYRADVYWNAATKTVYLNVKNLPDAPAGKQYQLWALKDGKPMDMGVFSGKDPDHMLKEMGTAPGAEAFAVTLEPAGGSENPTLEEMYVYGTSASI